MVDTKLRDTTDTSTDTSGANEAFADEILGNLDRAMCRRIWAGRAVYVGYTLGSAALAVGIIGLLVHKITWPLALTLSLTAGGGGVLFASLKKHFHLHTLKQQDAKLNGFGN